MDKRKFWLVARKYATLAILIVFVIAMSLLTDRFLTFKNLTNVGRQLSFNAIISVAMTMVIISGGSTCRWAERLPWQGACARES